MPVLSGSPAGGLPTSQVGFYPAAGFKLEVSTRPLGLVECGLTGLWAGAPVGRASPTFSCFVDLLKVLHLEDWDPGAAVLGSSH